MLCLVQGEMRPPGARTGSPQRAARPPVQPGKKSATAEPASGPSTRLSGLMRRIQAKASDCQTQIESFVSGHFRNRASTSKQGVLIGPVVPSKGPALNSPAAVRQYLFPGESGEQSARHACVIRLSTLTPATLHSAHKTGQADGQPSDGPFNTWNAPSGAKSRPDLSSVGFRPDKHVTCIEVTLVNNASQPLANNASQPAEPSKQRKTYCFGESPKEDDKSPVSSRSSSRGSDQFDSGFEEMREALKRPRADAPAPTSASVLRSILDEKGGASGPGAAKVQPRRSTVRREKAFRERSKHAWSRAKELEHRRNNELLERFHQIRKRLGEEEDERRPESLATGRPPGGPDELGPLPTSIVKTLVRQYDEDRRSRDKIVPSRLNSKRSSRAAFVRAEPTGAQVRPVFARRCEQTACERKNVGYRPRVFFRPPVRGGLRR